MILKLNISVQRLRAAVLAMLVSTALVGIVLGHYLGSAYFVFFAGGLWAMLGIAMFFGWLRLQLPCPVCHGMADIDYRYQEGPLGPQNYPVVICPHCKNVEVI